MTCGKISICSILRVEISKFPLLTWAIHILSPISLTACSLFDNMWTSAVITVFNYWKVLFYKMLLVLDVWPSMAIMQYRLFLASIGSDPDELTLSSRPSKSTSWIESRVILWFSPALLPSSTLWLFYVPGWHLTTNTNILSNFYKVEATVTTPLFLCWIKGWFSFRKTASDKADSTLSGTSGADDYRCGFFNDWLNRKFPKNS